MRRRKSEKRESKAFERSAELGVVVIAVLALSTLFSLRLVFVSFLGAPYEMMRMLHIAMVGPLGDATASRRHTLRTNVRTAGGGLQVGRTQRSVSLDEKPQVVHPVSKEPPEQNEPKPQVVNLSDEQVNNLAEKPQIVFGSEREPVKNLGEKPQVLNPDVDPVGNYKEKPNTLKATYPGPYGERDPVPQIPVPPSLGYGVPVGNIQVPTTPRPPKLKGKCCGFVGEAYFLRSERTPPSPPLKLPAASPITTLTFLEPGCFYKSERYEHGESVETPEPCLNCTCQKGVLVCYLRVCPTIGTPAPGCFTAREAGQCCPSVFCSGDKKSETTTTPPPPTDDDYYDYPATIDYDTDTSHNHDYHHYNKEALHNLYSTPSVIVEQTEQSTIAEDDVTVTATELSSTTTTTTKAATQTSSEATTARRPVTTFTSTTAAQKHQSAGTSSTPKDVAVTATIITPTVTTSLPLKTTTKLVDPSGSGHGDNVEVPSESPASRQNTVQRPVHKDTTSPTTRTPSTTAAAADLEARTPAKPFGQDSDSNKRPEVIEGVPKVVVAATTTTTTTGGRAKVASTTALPFDSNEALADAGYVAGTASPNEVEASVRKPLTDDEPVNSVEDALKGGGRDSIMFVSSTPLPFELHHSFDLQDLNTVSGACLDEASLYAEGSAMLSSNFCNYCYCIRGLKRCVQPKCHLAVEDCEPQFTSQYDCCPASYACTQGPNATTPLPPPTTSTPTTASTTTTAATTTTTTSTTTTTTEGPVVIPIQDSHARRKRTKTKQNKNSRPAAKALCLISRRYNGAVDEEDVIRPGFVIQDARRHADAVSVAWGRRQGLLSSCSPAATATTVRGWRQGLLGGFSIPITGISS
ncbi:hypothetical protein HPB51_021343 [Rhipicephalus microplus]|uniref:VWFC domain-containing protein n=1 Tax=Rhipicephalus microplus TaxID=6941 RepID=A0A9J6F7U8_RHIMP|nr:hypothetical protein HPB51_021343 [Rhipicephalus microplus]